MKNLLQNYFGTYTPLTDADGNILEGIASWDIPYILGVIIFVVFVYCLLKILGGILNGK